MVGWINNFQEFEKKQKRTNRLILNFYNPDIDGRPVSGKLFLKKKVKIPSDSIYPYSKKGRNKATAIVHDWLENYSKLGHGLKVNLAYGMRDKEELVRDTYGIDVEIGKTDYHVFELEIDKNPILLKKLERFQKGDYDKLLRLNGYYPERKLDLSSELESVLIDAEGFRQGKGELEDFRDINSRLKSHDKDNEFYFDKESKEYEIELNSENGFKFRTIEVGYGDAVEIEDEFLTAQELRDLPSLYLDIEKPLFKSDAEKILIKKRKDLLKLSRKINSEEKRDNGRKTLYNILVEDIEGQLTIDVSGVGKVGLYEERFDSAISFYTTIWKKGDEEIKELYLIDYNGNIDYDDWKGYKLFKFRDEKGLLKHFKEKVDERKPIVSYGHNQAYDTIQTRFAFEKDFAEKFDPAVRDVSVRRDFVRKFCQRLKEDMIYIDTLWINSSLHQLRQRKLGFNRRLDSVAQFYGIDFEKGKNYDELRINEVQRIASDDKDLVYKVTREMLDYATGDVGPLVEIIGKSGFIDFLVMKKEKVPYCTYTELAFSSSSMEKVHDKRHFDRARNIRDFKQGGKKNQELEIWKKRFDSDKLKKLRGIESRLEQFPRKEEEHYLVSFSPGEWISDIIFDTYPDFKDIYEKTKENPLFRQFLLPDIERLGRDIFIDSYFIEREEKSKLFEAKGLNNEEIGKFDEFADVCGQELVNDCVSSFRSLRHGFRSVYRPLDGEDRTILRKKKERGRDLFSRQDDIYTDSMKKDSELFILKDRAVSIARKLDDEKKRLLEGFLSSFDTFEEKFKMMAAVAEEFEIPESFGRINDFVYEFMRRSREKKLSNKLYAKYLTSNIEIREMLDLGYKNLEECLIDADARVTSFGGTCLRVALPSGNEIKEGKGIYVLSDITDRQNALLEKVDLPLFSSNSR